VQVSREDELLLLVDSVEKPACQAAGIRFRSGFLKSTVDYGVTRWVF
jgi:hypothetical protein